MSGLHLNHKVHWSDFKCAVLNYKDPGIHLPVGKCGCIHIINKKIELQVKNRPYLADKLCDSPTCSESTEKKVFRKTLKHTCSLNPCMYRMWDKLELKHFINSFTEAIHEFANTERKKVGNRIINTNPNRDIVFEETVEMLKQKHSDLISVGNMVNHWCWNYDRLCVLFPILIEAGEVETLLLFNDDEIRAVFSCLHGGQAVGNNWAYLYHNVMKVYLYSNLIAAFGLENKESEWGEMSPKRYFRNELMYDHDGQTFLDSSRQYLKEDVYMQDWESMRQLCKNCFKFLYITEMLAKEVGISWLDNHSPWRW